MTLVKLTSYKAGVSNVSPSSERIIIYNNRPILADMADCEVLERFRLSRPRIQWLVDELERNTSRSRPLSPETQVNIVLLLLLLSLHV